MAERIVVHKILALLTSMGAWNIKHHGGMYSAIGVPDILACLNGRFIGIEVKDGDGIEPTKIQAEQLRRIRAAGGVAFHTGSLLDCISKLRTAFGDGVPVAVPVRGSNTARNPGDQRASEHTFASRPALVDGYTEPDTYADSDADASHASPGGRSGE